MNKEGRNRQYQVEQQQAAQHGEDHVCRFEAALHFEFIETRLRSSAGTDAASPLTWCFKVPKPNCVHKSGDANKRCTNWMAASRCFTVSGIMMVKRIGEPLTFSPEAFV